MTDDRTCHRCWKQTVECEVCKGDGRVWGMFGDCTECDGTGRVCPTDGKYWQ
jgi:RecJ-like exonuclease